MKASTVTYDCIFCDKVGITQSATYLHVTKHHDEERKEVKRLKITPLLEWKNKCRKGYYNARTAKKKAWAFIFGASLRFVIIHI